MKELVHHTSQYVGHIKINEETDYFNIDKNVEIGGALLLKIPDRWRTKDDLIKYLDGIKKIIKKIP